MSIVTTRVLCFRRCVNWMSILLKRECLRHRIQLGPLCQMSCAPSQAHLNATNVISAFWRNTSTRSNITSMPSAISKQLWLKKPFLKLFPLLFIDFFMKYPREFNIFNRGFLFIQSSQALPLLTFLIILLTSYLNEYLTKCCEKDLITKCVHHKKIFSQKNLLFVKLCPSVPISDWFNEVKTCHKTCH